MNARSASVPLASIKWNNVQSGDVENGNYQKESAPYKPLMSPSNFNSDGLPYPAQNPVG